MKTLLKNETKLLYNFLMFSFTVFVLLSNHFDWDHFFTAAEFEFRSWMVFGELPVWSYGFCGGATRLGDPQSFALSPLFTFILIFGSYWGLKLLVVFLTGLGFWSAYQIGLKLFSLYHREPADVPTSKLIFLSASAFTFGNYFLWHIHHGHVTFLLNHIILWVIWKLLESFDTEIRKRNLVLITFVSFCYFSSAIYHSIVFFMIPLTLSLAVTLLCGLAGGFSFFDFWKTKGRKQTLLFLSAVIFGLLLGSYKLIGVSRYQAENPRVLSGSVSSQHESISALDAAALQLFPTFNYSFIPKATIGSWGIWEQSAFNLNAYLLLGFILFWILPTLLKRFQNVTKFWSTQRADQRFILFFFVIAAPLVVISLLLGEGSPLSIFRYMNALLHGSVRVLGRFQILLIFSVFAVVCLLFKAESKWKTILIKIRPLIYVLIILNFFTFTTLNRDGFFAESETKVSVPEKTQIIYVVPIRDMAHSYMYSAARSGYVVPNCYNPIAREMRTFGELGSINANIGHPPRRLIPNTLYRIVDATASNACASGSSVSENKIIPGAACPSGTCFLLNGLSPGDRKSGNFFFNSVNSLYCMK